MVSLQSTGRAESAVKNMKKLIRGSWTSGSFNQNAFAKSILLFRNAPRSGAASPAQMVFGRPVRDCLPVHRRSFAPEWQKAADVLEKRACRAKELHVEHFNRNAHPLPPFQVGDHVVIQHPQTKCWATPGTVVEVGPNRDYLIKAVSGRLFRRNHRHLRKRVPVMPAHQPSALAQHEGPDMAQNQHENLVPVQQDARLVEPCSPVVRRSARPKKPNSLYPEDEWSK